MGATCFKWGGNEVFAVGSGGGSMKPLLPLDGQVMLRQRLKYARSRDLLLFYVRFRQHIQCTVNMEGT